MPTKRLAMYSCLFLCLLTAGCADPGKRVKVVLVGAEDQKTWQDVVAILPSLVDDPENTDNGLIAKEASRVVVLHAIKSPQKFAERIRFGQVERVQGYEVVVRVDVHAARLLALSSRAKALSKLLGKKFDNFGESLCQLLAIKAVYLLTGDLVYWLKSERAQAFLIVDIVTDRYIMKCPEWAKSQPRSPGSESRLVPHSQTP